MSPGVRADVAMRRLTVDVEKELYLRAKLRAGASGLTLSEVVRKLLAAYVEWKVVRGPNDERE